MALESIFQTIYTLKIYSRGNSSPWPRWPFIEWMARFSIWMLSSAVLRNFWDMLFQFCFCWNDCMKWATSQIKMDTTLFLGFQAKWQKLGRNEVMRILMLLCVSLKKIFTRTSNTRVLFKSRFNANAHFLVEYLIFFWSDNSYQWPNLLGNMLC